MPAKASHHGRDRNHPDFPHGTLSGYTYGCRAPEADTCPGQPTCAATKAAQGAEYRRRGAADHNGGRITVYVAKRLNVTLRHTSVEQVAYLSGVTPARVRMIAARDPEVGTRVPEAEGDALDALWALLVHGKDVHALTNHGEERTYREELCRCPPCTAAASRNHKRVLAGTRVAGTNVPITPSMTAHTKRLVRAAGTATELARLIGVHVHTVANITKTRRVGTTAQVAAALLALTPAQVAAETTADPLVCARRSQLHVQSLYALGYTLGWVRDQIAAEGGAGITAHFTGQKYVRASLARKIERLADRVSDKPATTSDGLEPRVIDRAKGIARRNGWYPPAYYDDDGTLDVRAIPDHPWSKLDERAAKTVEGARMLAQGETHSAAARHIGVSSKTTGRYAKDLGFVYDKRQALDHVASRATIRRVCDLYNDYIAGERGPVTTALMLGLLDADLIAKDHPEVAAWFTDHPETQEEAA